MWNRRDIVKAGAALTTAAALGRPAFAQGGSEKVTVDLRREVGPLDHVWSRCVGSDRPAMTLREGWRQDLDRFHNEAGLERVRFHGIFADELGVWSAGAKPNFQYVDAIYDGLLERGVQPFVELSYVDMDPGSPFPTWRKLGSPQYPTPAQMAQIRASSEIAAPEMRQLGKDDMLSIDLPPEGIALIELV
jgi:hypothetical protein